MKLKTASAFALGLLVTSAAMAQTTAPAPDYTLSYNAAAVSDYRVRGLSQTSFKPALQVGVDFAHKSGFYLGAWGSNVNWIKDYVGNSATPAVDTKGPIEIDLSAGYKGSISKDLAFDVGIITYQYPGNTASKVTVNADTTEIYGALTYGIVTAKYSRSIGNSVANPNSAGSTYWEVAANIDLGNGFTLMPHAGRQTIPNVSAPQPDGGNYTDYALTLSKDFGNGLSASLSAIGTNAKDGFYKVGGFDNLGKSTAVIGLKYNF
jgi:uncharacterized protein (TIGR02001 family)